MLVQGTLFMFKLHSVQTCARCMAAILESYVQSPKIQVMDIRTCLSGVERTDIKIQNSIKTDRELAR